MGRAKRLRVKNLPQKLKQIRESLNVSQGELIAELGFTDIIYQANVSEYESGKREPPMPIVLAYAYLIGVHLEVLVDDDLDLPEKSLGKQK